MKHEIRLLTGQITDAEYFGTIDAASRGLRLPIARRGWPRRFYRVTEGIVTLVLFILLMVALCANVTLICATIDGCLPS